MDLIVKARIEAAAPDLLAACQSMLNTCGGSEYWQGETRESLLLMEAAVAKAGFPHDSNAAVTRTMSCTSPNLQQLPKGDAAVENLLLSDGMHRIVESFGGD